MAAWRGGELCDLRGLHGRGQELDGDEVHGRGDEGGQRHGAGHQAVPPHQVQLALAISI